MPRRLRIGLTARFLHPDPQRAMLQNRTLLYVEQSLAHWVMSRDVLVFMIPSIERGAALRRSNLHVADYVEQLDGLVLQGGADIAPQSYGETPLSPEWSGDRVRDMYEIELLQEFVTHGKPVLGVCRGCQLINVVFGGTLYQDIAFQVPETLQHRHSEKYEEHFHEVKLLPESGLSKLYPGRMRATINTIHHQAVKDVGKGLVVEAMSEPDGIVEAIRWRGASHVLGVQWHPEFHDPRNPDLLDGTPILNEFLAAARQRVEA
jgi:gamma-glutamyl-gamma-aminobutyrate hydrolase PuuD